MERGMCTAVCKYKSGGKVLCWNILSAFKLLPGISVHHDSLNNHYVIVVP